MINYPILSSEYFRETEVLLVARELLGKVLVTDFAGRLTSGIIVETEAYRAPEDKASHAYQNKLTNRTKTMFLSGGISYVYLIYGIHNLFNVVIGPQGVAHAVLIRAIQPLENLTDMLSRSGKKSYHRISSGPGKLTKALGINRRNNGGDLTSYKDKIWIEDRGMSVLDEYVKKDKRVGVDYAEECSDWEWRFLISGNPWVSRQ